MVKSALFAETFAQKQRWVGRYMVLWKRTGADASLRLGVITSKKVSRRANQRNLARRRLREIYRNLRPYFSGNADLLIIARKSILEADWKTVAHEMLRLAQHAELISDGNRSRAIQAYIETHSDANESSA